LAETLRTEKSYSLKTEDLLRMAHSIRATTIFLFTKWQLKKILLLNLGTIRKPYQIHEKRLVRGCFKSEGT
jgi:hypothetical protein